MKPSLYSLAIVALVLFGAGCSGSKNLRGRVARIEGQLADVQVQQAELTARVDTLVDKSNAITGMLEELQFSQQHRIRGSVGTLQKELAQIQRRMPPPALVPLLALEEDEAILSKLQPEEARVFGNSLTKLRSGGYREALPGLKDLYQRASNEDLRARVLFWIGVSEQGATNNPEALRVYHQLTQNFPSHKRIPLTLLRQASVFVLLRDTQTARLTLEKLIRQYPRTAEANDARARLKKLK